MELLNDMALFVEVVNAKGFRRAAEATGIPNSTLSRRISALEKAIGLRLLHRTTRKIELTEAGQRYFERCRRIVDEARLAHEHLGDMLAQPSGVLRASLPVDFATTYLAPLIAEFAHLYPGITFDLDLTSRRVDLVSEPFDVAIRIGESEPSHLIARPLTTFTPHLYASPRYLDQAGEPDTPEALQQHRCLGMLKATAWTLHAGTRTVTVPVSGRFLLNSMGMIRRLATLDMGIVLMPDELVADELAQGTLRRLLPHWHGAPQPVYAVTETRLLPAKTQRFIEFLRERLGRE
ncbi:LysR family transcriptional regulator [Pseudomonas mangiferae]|uniref:LysR family transcriptional regulator n=1 Tax=Pseudomonas mangiferae TaxID=2593654 RepID=A0A553H3T5_9PSED|nr:LysR family transcriptional regulator [Pseudomonas mangiferae]TRX76415.1 LysR family transcriptional regulator [Pseudomonas mangiferae]